MLMRSVRRCQLIENGALRGAQLRTGFDAYLVHEDPMHAGIDAQGVGSAAGQAKRKHELLVKAFPQRVEGA